ncbi:MAG: hypothetical protein H0U03_06695 [Actinobacteria bacterium]|nr:hypothetical protein [Actinomycetota bacterium]
MTRALALDLDSVIGDTRPLWREWLADAARRYGSIAPLDPATLAEDRVEAASQLDRWAEAGIGDWRSALGRFAEDRAPLHFRRDPETSTALRRLGANGVRIGAFTDAPGPLANVAIAHLGLGRRLDSLEAGTAALERLLMTLGENALVVRSSDELRRLAQ